MKHANPFDIICAMNIGAGMKAKLALILTGNKPLSYVKVYKCNDSPELVKQELRRAGFYFMEVSREEGNSQHVCTLSVSVRQELVPLLKTASENWNEREIGQLLGFPSTAVNAYVNKKGLLLGRDYPVDMKNNPLVFKFSKDAQVVEIDKVRDWMEVLKAYTPSLYDELFSHLLVK